MDSLPSVGLPVQEGEVGKNLTFGGLPPGFPSRPRLFGDLPSLSSVHPGPGSGVSPCCPVGDVPVPPIGKEIPVHCTHLTFGPEVTLRGKVILAYEIFSPTPVFRKDSPLRPRCHIWKPPTRPPEGLMTTDGRLKDLDLHTVRAGIHASHLST